MVSIASPALFAVSYILACVREGLHTRRDDSNHRAPSKSNTRKVEQGHVKAIRRFLDLSKNLCIVFGNEVGNLLLDLSLPALFVDDFSKVWILDLPVRMVFC